MDVNLNKDQAQALLREALDAIEALGQACDNLLPGARYIVADIGLINDALLGGSRVQREIRAFLDK